MDLSARKGLDIIRSGSVKLLTGIGHKVPPDVPPGTPVFVGERRTEAVRMTYMRYTPDVCEEEDLETAASALPVAGREGVAWINVSGVHDVELISDIGEALNLHPLVCEDVANTRQRPKFEDYESHLYVVIRMLQYDAEERQIVNEQVSLVLGPGYVLTFQEREGDVFGPLRDRIRQGKGRIRGFGPDYLFYALLDAIVDGYFSVLEGIGTYVESIEDIVMTNPEPSTLADIHELRTQTAFLRKSVWPLREAIAAFDRSESELIEDSTKAFVRDVYDHSVQLMDTIEAFRDVASSLFETHLSMVGNQMNEIMKVLTIIATIFIPITFIAGIYGMNFERMPELSWPWAYPAVWGVMIAVTVGMLVYFKRRNWL